MKRNTGYHKGYLIYVLMLALILCSTSAFGAIIRVPGDQPTIQAGIDAASDGDTVLVADGPYTGPGNKNLDFLGKAITVQSENGPENCIINCEGVGNAFHFFRGEGQDSVVSGFTIENSEAGYDAILCDNSSPIITNCTITDNGGSGIMCYMNSSPTITNCTITGNTADYGGGIHCYDSSPIITNCTITGNITKNTGAIHGAENSSLTITDCTITGNSGGGINLYSSSATITSCRITGNTRRGITCSDSSPTITNCVITGNTYAGGGGAGIDCGNSSPTITNCTISNNTTGYDGGGIRCQDNSSPTIINCTISNNTASRDGGGIFCRRDSSPTVTNSILWADSPDEISIASGVIAVTYSDIEGGWEGMGNIDADPLLVGGGNYHLTAHSPCIDTGTNDAPELPAFDFEGDARIIDGNDDGTATADMGADEYAPHVVAKSLYDDFSGTYIDGQKWRERELVREVDPVGGKLVSKMGNAPSTGGFTNTGFQNPELITAIECELTVVATNLDTGSEPSSFARIGGFFYNTQVSGGATGDIWAAVYIGDRGNGGLEAYWLVAESLSDDLTDFEDKGSDTLMDPGTLAHGTPYSVKIEYDGDNGFTFTVAGASDSFFGPARQRPAVTEFRGLGTGIEADGGSGIGYVSALFDDVYINNEATPYDTFDSAPLDQTKWDTLEHVREISGGKLRLNVQAEGSRTDATLRPSEQATAYLEAKVLVERGSQVSPGATGIARIGGWYYNDSRGPGSGQDYNGYEGDIWIDNRIILDDSDNLVARCLLWRSNFDQSSGTTVDVHYFASPIAFDMEYTLSIESTGSRFIFTCNDETYQYDVTTPMYPPSEGQYRQLKSRVYADPGESGYMKAHFDDVYTTPILTVITGLGSYPSNGGWIEVCGGDYSHDNWLRIGWGAYNSANGEARIATGDIDGDGRDEIIIGLGPVPGDPTLPGGWFQVLDNDYTHLGWGRINWGSYNSVNGESWPACGDVDGDGRDEIIIGLGPYPVDGGWFEIFDYTSPDVTHKAWRRLNWGGYNSQSGETRPACGDIDGDDRDEIVIGLGDGGEGYLEVFDDALAGYVHLAWSHVHWEGYCSGNGESWPACGDVDGDGKDEIVIGLGAYPVDGGWFEIFDYTSPDVTHKAWRRLNWGGYNSQSGETRPACGDIDGDGRDEIVIGLGDGGEGWLEVFDDAFAGYVHVAWPHVHWGGYCSDNGETWPAVKR